MIIDELTFQIRRQFGFTPTAEQDKALQTFAMFLTDRDPHAVMILRGSAGTGKTSLAGAIVRTMKTLKQKVMLLAPTGRAAKVFSVNSGQPAFTIHRKIYRQRSFSGVGGQFNLNDNLYADTLFMVDESSMIANEGLNETSFGSGRLLDDLVSFVYQGRNCRMMLIGDKAQLPPVGEEESPALSATMLEGYGLKVYQCDLNEVLRQSHNSGILFNATAIRQLIVPNVETVHAPSPKTILPKASNETVHAPSLPQIRFYSFADIVMVPGNELIESLNTSYSQVGMDETMVITRSNKRVNIYNQGIRNTILDREDMLATGDMLMVVKNNYYWTEKDKADIPFIANGDRARVQRVRNVRELYGFNFADVWLQFPDYDDYEMQCTVIMDSLMTDAPALSREQNEQLFTKVMEDYADIPLKPDRMKRIRQDDYFNALQVKFAYATTCHKAQGGQWAHVYIDQGYITEDMMDADYIHWLYTAFTRATEKLFLVNWPPQLTDGRENQNL